MFAQVFRVFLVWANYANKPKNLLNFLFYFHQTVLWLFAVLSHCFVFCFKLFSICMVENSNCHTQFRAPHPDKNYTSVSNFCFLRKRNKKCLSIWSKCLTHSHQTRARFWCLFICETFICYLKCFFFVVRRKNFRFNWMSRFQSSRFTQFRLFVDLLFFLPFCTWHDSEQRARMPF